MIDSGSNGAAAVVVVSEGTVVSVAAVVDDSGAVDGADVAVVVAVVVAEARGVAKLWVSGIELVVDESATVVPLVDDRGRPG